MARPKSYDRTEAVRAVRDAFWEHGYGALSISAIEERTGLGRFAIRTEFGGKEGLFLEALADYAADAETYMFAPLRENGTLDGIVALLRSVVTPFEGSPRRFGCLMVNTSIENASARMPSLRKRTDRHWQRLGDAFHIVLSAERKRGALRDDIEIDDAVQFLVGTVIGALVVNRNAGIIDAAEGQIRMAIDTVNRWRSEVSWPDKGKEAPSRVP